MIHSTPAILNWAQAFAHKVSVRWLQRDLWLHSLVLFLMGLFIFNQAWANPTGAQVTNGQASFENQGGILTITNTPGTIINWQKFSIASGETTRFIQQNAQSAVLNRVVGSEGSSILGNLLSNGKVWLINPNGILFGPQARVDVGGLVASSLQISDQDFLAGHFEFLAGSSAEQVGNQGSIRTASGGQVYLIAPDVENHGIIQAPNGQVLLAAGHKVSLVDSQDPNLQVLVSAPEDKALNLGQILADGGAVSIYGALVRQAGSISANRAVADGEGRIFLKASGNVLVENSSVTRSQGGLVMVQAGSDALVNGMVDVSSPSGVGGTVHLLGDRVALESQAQVLASGSSGGGTVLVGGDYQGSNPDIPNARQTRLDSGARIEANATTLGNGGKVILWGDETLQAQGTIEARGGADGGDGGFIETSSKYLDTQGVNVDTRSLLGQTGMWLLDPIDIVIQSAASPTDPNGSFSSGNWVTTTTNTTSYICVGGGSACGIGLIEQLGTTNVTIDTNQGSGGNGDISVIDSISWSSGKSLTLKSDGSTYVNASIDGGSGGLLINADSVISLDDASVNASQITMTTGSYLSLIGTANINATGVFSLTRAGGNLTLGYSTDTIDISASGFSITPGQGLINSPQIKLYAPAGDVQINSNINYVGGSLYLESSGNISQSGSINTNYLSTQSAGSGGIVLSNSSNSVSAFRAKTTAISAPINFVNSGSLVLNGINSAGGNVTVDAGGSINNQAPGVDACGTVSSCTSWVRLTSNSGSLTTALVKAGSSVFLEAYGGNIIDGDGAANNIVSGGVQPVELTYTASGNVDLDAWGATIHADSSASGTVNVRLVEPTPTPTLDQCIANPTLTGCTAVLPTLASCISDPTLAGCSAVLPSLVSCTSDPTIAGCSAVLPSLASCTLDPTIAGCSAVLPSLASCNSDPTIAGCGAVLPSLASCTSDPMLTGCSVVLPSLDVCMATPASTGCSVVLPPLAVCISFPSTVGCSVVLPSTLNCSSNPSLNGCQVVLHPSQLIQLEGQQQTPLIQAINLAAQGCSQSGFNSSVRDGSSHIPGERYRSGEEILNFSAAASISGEGSGDVPDACN